MSRLERKRARQWARYVNRYAHMDMTYIGGVALSRTLWDGMLSNGASPYKYIRRQAKR